LRIWLDMANSPHPVLLGPVAEELESRGHELFVTGRDHAQTRELTSAQWPRAAIIGGESPSTRAAKGVAIAKRIAGLRGAAAGRVDAAVSLNSYAQIVAARSLGVPTLTLMDYEHQPANHISFRLARRIVVPSYFPRGHLKRYGAKRPRVSTFEGFKEELYLDKVQAHAPPVRRVPGKSLAVFRPPPEGALYHRHGNDLFEEILREAIQRENVQVVVLPRFVHQTKTYTALSGVTVPDSAIGGTALLEHADIFVGAGGTMSREAALLGVRSYTVFSGELASVDRELIQKGLLQDLRNPGAATAPIDWSGDGDRRTEEMRLRRQNRARELRGWLATRIEELETYVPRGRR
jgi:predicted glycosyltransferase